MPALPFLQMDVKGMEELQLARLQLMLAIDPKGGLGEAVKTATIHLWKYATTITHVVTGSLKASHTMNFGAGRLTTSFLGATIRREAVGHIEISPNTRNPITGERPAEYGPIEHAKGGSHAFYQRAVSEQGSVALTLAHSVMYEYLPKGSIAGSWLGGRAKGFDLMEIWGL